MSVEDCHQRRHVPRLSRQSERSTDIARCDYFLYLSKDWMVFQFNYSRNIRQADPWRICAAAQGSTLAAGTLIAKTNCCPSLLMLPRFPLSGPGSLNSILGAPCGTPESY